jgi:putative hydrolase of the HAD superfamily
MGPDKEGRRRLNESVELITIDLDDTLWPCLETIQRAEDALYAWLGERAPRLTDAHDQASLREHRRGYVQANPLIAHDLTAVRRDSLADLLLAFGYDGALAEDALDVFLAHRNRVEPFPDVAPALRALAGSHRLVSVTNGNSDVSRTPLRGLFHLSLTAADVGAAKPDPALFRAALDWAGLTPTQALHLGDHPYLDIQAARELGMQAIWVNRNGQRWPAELEPPLAEVADMRALQRWLDGGSGGV